MVKWEEIVLRGAALERLAGEHWKMAVYTRPFGRDLICEAADVEFAQDAQIPYHTRQHGYETVLLLSGCAEVTLYGKCCTLEPGDLVEIESFMPCGFQFLKESVVRVIAPGVDMARICREGVRIHEAYPAGEQRAALLNELYQAEGIRLLVEPVAERVEKTALPEVSAKGSGQEIFPLHGVTCRLRVGRWQIGGKAEAWEYGMDAGKTLSCPGTAPGPSLFMVCDGSAEVETGGEKRSVKSGDLLWLAPYQAFSLTAGDAGAALLDCHCSATLLRYLEEWEAAQAAPESGVRQADLAAQNRSPLQGLE